MKQYEYTVHIWYHSREASKRYFVSWEQWLRTLGNHGWLLVYVEPDFDDKDDKMCTFTREINQSGLRDV